ncbi:hypothetical protein NC651_010910 [Populus alba x Populus x berolinensis]|nr:hypothetical protein NC651_010910 [Populus alba x Populus x berolinensis]
MCGSGLLVLVCLLVRLNVVRLMFYDLFCLFRIFGLWWYWWFNLRFFPGSFALRALSASICCCFLFGLKTMLPFIGCKLDCCLKLGIKEHGFQSLLGSTSLDFDEETTSSQKHPWIPMRTLACGPAQQVNVPVQFKETDAQQVYKNPLISLGNQQNNGY